MGYRSDVTAVFYAHKKVGENPWPTLKLFIDENFPEELKGALEFRESSSYVGYTFTEYGVKWYDSYPEIVAFNRFVSNYLEIADGENELAWAYEFVRIGEESDDTEVTYSDGSDCVLQVSRATEINF
jgi:hypothetical protein